MATYVKEAIEKHGASAAIEGVTGIRIKRIGGTLEFSAPYASRQRFPGRQLEGNTRGL
jgi:hypothetical protein